MALQLWDRLWATGLQDIAPALYDHGARSVEDITPNANAAALICAGVPSWKLEAVVRGRLETEICCTLALEAAQPAKRQAALDALQADILSGALQGVGEASLSHNTRGDQVRWCQPQGRGVQLMLSLLRGCHWAPASRHGEAGGRGGSLGSSRRLPRHSSRTRASHLEGQLRCREGLVGDSREKFEWALGQQDSEVDLCVIAAHLLVPVSRADSKGSLTVRTYACLCKARNEALCRSLEGPWHEA